MPVRGHPAAGAVLDHVGCQFPVDRAAEPDTSLLVRPCSAPWESLRGGSAVRDYPTRVCRSKERCVKDSLTAHIRRAEAAQQGGASGPALGAHAAARPDDEVDAVEARGRGGGVGAPVGAARLAPRERGGRDQPRERVGVAEQALEAPRASRRGPAFAQTAARVASVGGSKRQRRQRGRRRPRVLGARAASAARAPKTKHSLSEFDASRLAPWRPVHAHSPTAKRPGRVERPVEVGDDPAHQVVGGGRHRDRLRRRARGPASRERRDDVGEAARGRCRAGRARRLGAVGRHPVEDRRGDLVARRELVGEARPAASSSVAPSPRTASVISDAVERGRPAAPARSGGTGRTRGRRGRRRPRGRGPGPAPIAPHGFVVRAPQRRGAAGREHRRRRRDRAAVGDHPGAARAVAPQRHRRGALEHLDPRCAGGELGEPAGQCAPGLAAARVDDPPRRVAALEPEREAAVGLGVEARRRGRCSASTAAGRLAREDLDRARRGRCRARRRACPRRGARASRRAPARRRARPGPRSSRSRRAACARPARPALRARRPRRRRRGRRRRRRRRRRRTSDAGRCACQGAVTVVADAGLYVRHPSSLEHDTGPHPENADRVRAIEAALERDGWLGLERVEAPAATERAAPARAPRRARRDDRAAQRARAAG